MKFYNYILIILRYLFNFLFPNYFSLINGKVKIGKTWRFSQYTTITGRGKVEIGSHCSFGFIRGGFHRGGVIEIQARTLSSKVTIGSNVSTNNNIFICSSGRINIGNSCLIGQYVTFMDFEAHEINPSRRKCIGEIGTIEIGNNVWIGNNVTILKNSKVGDNSIVATGAVVTGVFPSNVIIGGVPARIIKSINEQ